MKTSTICCLCVSGADTHSRRPLLLIMIYAGMLLGSCMLTCALDSADKCMRC